MFLDDLKAFLTEHSYTDITRDTMPDKPDECIGLLLWDDVPGTVGSWRYVQIQVRRIDGDDAYAAAYAIRQLLDSEPDGQSQKRIQLTPDRWCIAKPRRGPKKLSADNRGTVYYIEVALWGDNKP